MGTRVLSACMSVHHMHAWHLRRTKEGVGSPRTGVTDSCELLWECWEPNPSSQKNSQCSKLTVHLYTHLLERLPVSSSIVWNSPAQLCSISNSAFWLPYFCGWCHNRQCLRPKCHLNFSDTSFTLSLASLSALHSYRGGSGSREQEVLTHQLWQLLSLQHSMSQR